MYLAIRKTNREVHYVIRESVLSDDGSSYLSRDLFDLGSTPEQWLQYPGGYAVIVDPEVESQIHSINPLMNLDELEELLDPFINPEIRNRAELFRHRYRTNPSPKLTPAEIERIGKIHLFDKRRLLYLRNGSLDQNAMTRTPGKLFRPLLDKSRDEIEQYLLRQESALEPEEYRQYAFVVFNVQRSFSEISARVMPAALDQKKMADRFEEAFCEIRNDATYAFGLKETDLITYLSRYVVMFYDHQFPEISHADDFIQRFMNNHRQFHFPSRNRDETYERAAEIFGEERQNLEKMSHRELKRLYRKFAHAHHPDKGGNQEDFVETTELYQTIIKGKK
ncbi:MAG: hypothetical protein KJ950_03685 [Proteobacteria bacterium]|nr:hypothetical protein [Pseudomonadota bacterium]MBU1686421.1 hypothetical protein [Pseudomonadota bacterium]